MWMLNIDPAFPSNKYRLLTRDLTRAQTSLITQLRTGHAPLNKRLHRIKKANSPLCKSCLLAEESTHHYLLECRAHSHARVAMSRKLGRKATSMKHLLNSAVGVCAVLKIAAEIQIIIRWCLPTSSWLNTQEKAHSLQEFIQRKRPWA